MNFNSGMSNLNPTFWAREAERSLFVENKAMAIANTTLRNLVAGEGDTVNKTILSYPASSTYTPGTDITNVAVAGSKESLSIATWFASMVTVDDTEKKQSIIDIGKLVATRMMHDHNNRIEQNVLNETTNAQWSIDDGNVGGTAGNRISLNTGNIPQVFIAADEKLDAVDAPRAGRTAVVGGHFLGTLKLQEAGRPGSPYGDGVNTRGVVANKFGWDILYSNNLPYQVTLKIPTNPTDGDTISFQGVTLTFKSTLGTTAGNVIIGTANTDTATNLNNVINDFGTSIAATATAGYNKVSDENIFLLRDKRRLSSTVSGTTLTISGFGDVVVKSSFTAAANAFSAHAQDVLFLVAGAIDIIVQIPPVVEVVRNPKQFADIVKSLLGFGKKTYADGAREMVDVKIAANTSDWA